MLVLSSCGQKKFAKPDVFRLIDHLDKVEFVASPFPELIPGKKRLEAKDRTEKILARRNQVIESLIEPIYWEKIAVHPLVLKFTKIPVLRQEVGQRTKNVLVVPPKTVFRIRRKIAAGSVLEFGLGVLNARFEDLHGGIQFRILASGSSADNPRIVYSRTLQPRLEPRDLRWIDALVDLKDFAGEKIWLTFETAESGGEASPAPFI